MFEMTNECTMFNKKFLSLMLDYAVGDKRHTERHGNYLLYNSCVCSICEMRVPSKSILIFHLYVCVWVVFPCWLR